MPDQPLRDTPTVMMSGTKLLGEQSDFELKPDLPSPHPNVPGYQILERIAVGGMGIVYRALQRGLDRIVALKMVRGGRWIQDEELERFKAEAKAIAGIEHPNLVRIHDFGEYEGLPYFSMEFVDGGCMSQRLKSGAIPPREAAALIEIIARTMHVVHENHLIHRDLKPANILLMRDGTPKISDFGLVKRLGSNQGMTISGMVMGTVNYMAPEQARADRDVTAAVDVYAIGAILYECLTGRPPFEDDAYERTIRRVVDEQPVRPREINTEASAELETICLKCLEKEPGDRYPNAAELADDLRRFLNGEPLSIGNFDVIDQHTRWARKIGLDELDLAACTQWAFVYKAREAMINRRVILKICTGLVGSPAHDRLRRQAAAMAGLIHPNIEQLYLYAETGGQPYLIQEHVGGRSFSSMMRDRVVEREESARSLSDTASGEYTAYPPRPHEIFTPVTVDVAAQWVLELARAVQFLHEHHVIHGAIYPGEIRLTENGVPKLCGFGAAQKILPGQTPAEATANWVLPHFQPPEQLNGKWKLLGPAADIYSLGAVFYELLTGQAPFFGRRLADVRLAAGTELPTAPRNINDRIPSVLDWLCQRCLSPNPEDRFSSATELAQAIEGFLRGLEASNDETKSIEPIREPGLTSSEFELRVFIKTSRKPTFFPLPRRWVTIGRAPESDIVIADEFCSRNHCAIFWDERAHQHVLVLIKAKHGVKVNGELVRGSQALIPGDVIVISTARIVFERRRPVTETA